MEIKEKVLEEVYPIGDDIQAVDTSFAKSVIDKTLAEVGKVIDNFDFDRIVQLICDCGEDGNVDTYFNTALKQKLGIK